MYEVHPEFLDRMFLPEEQENMLELFKKNLTEIELKDVQYGDIIVAKYPPNMWHVLVVLNQGKALHCTRYGTDIVDYLRVKAHIKGVFRDV